MNDALAPALNHISATDDARVVVPTGVGKVFCVGTDLKGRAAITKAPGNLPTHSRRTRDCFHAVRECAKPVTVAINGAALGSGLAMCASADILAASEKRRLGMPDVDLGLLGGARHAMGLFSHQQLRCMALTGMRVDGAKLYRLSVVAACTALEGLMPPRWTSHARSSASARWPPAWSNTCRT